MTRILIKCPNLMLADFSSCHYQLAGLFRRSIIDIDPLLGQWIKVCGRQLGRNAFPMGKPDLEVTTGYSVITDDSKTRQSL